MNSTMKRGMFIVIDGIDGAGKTTQIELLAERLRQNNTPFHITHEPGGTSFGEKIREILLDPNEDIDPFAELLLIFAARAQHVNRIIKPKINAGEWVICSRFTNATKAYQGFGRNIPMQVIDDLAELTHPITYPDLNIFIDLSVDESNTRLKSRDMQDRFELTGDDFMQAVREGYLSIFEQSDDALCLNGAESIDTIHEQIWNAIESLQA